MIPEEEFAARSQLKWQRDGDAWILLYRRGEWGVSFLIRTIKLCGVRSNQVA